MKVSELFYSLQGEGIFVGLPSRFLRLSGCNLRCSWCDTPYASWENTGEELEVEEILLRVEKLPECRYLVLTGGEPFLHKDLPKLCSALRKMGHHLTVETAGTIYRKIEADLLSISPKTPASAPDKNLFPKEFHRHEVARSKGDVLHRLLQEHFCQLKFVVADNKDLNDVKILLKGLNLAADRILLMPQSRSREELDILLPVLSDFCLQEGLRLADRLHLRLWGNIRGH